MTNLEIRTEEPDQAQAQAHSETETPLLTENSNHGGEGCNNNKSEESEVDESLARLERFLKALGYNQGSVLSSVTSWAVFFALGVVVPLAALWLCDCSQCEMYELRGCEMVIVTFQASLAAVSLLCLSHNLRKYGLRRFLFVDRYTGHMPCFHREYVTQISVIQTILIVFPTLITQFLLVL